MNTHAISLKDMVYYAALFQEFCTKQGAQAHVEIGEYKTEPPDPPTLYGAADEDNWYYDDYTLVVPSAPKLVKQFGNQFVESLGDSRLSSFVSGSKLVLLRSSYPSQASDMLPVLVTNAIIVSGPKTKDGALVQSVSIAWHPIIDILLKDPSSMYAIPPRKWEEIIAGAYERAGFG